MIKNLQKIDKYDKKTTARHDGNPAVAALSDSTREKG